MKSRFNYRKATPMEKPKANPAIDEELRTVRNINPDHKGLLKSKGNNRLKQQHGGKRRSRGHSVLLKKDLSRHCKGAWCHDLHGYARKLVRGDRRGIYPWRSKTYWRGDDGVRRGCDLRERKLE